jgi:uncharacterized RDD family membrane protein YckC
MQPSPLAAATVPPAPVQDPYAAPAPSPYGAPPVNPYGAPPVNPYGPPPIGGYPGGYQLVAPLPPGVAGRQLAGYGARVGAHLLDLVFLIVTVGIMGIVSRFLMGRDGERNGQSLGKQIVGIRVVKADGSPVTVGFAFLRDFVVRYLLFGLLGSFLVVPGLLDLLWPLWDKPGQQTLTDKIVSSYVTVA